MAALTFLLGALLAVSLFFSLLWSLYKSASRPGKARAVHLACAALTVSGIALIDQGLVLAGFWSGMLLAVFAALALFLERRWSRLFPLAQLCLSAALVAGLPFKEG